MSLRPDIVSAAEAKPPPKAPRRCARPSRLHVHHASVRAVCAHPSGWTVEDWRYVTCGVCAVLAGRLIGV